MGSTFPIVLVHGVCRFDVLWKHAVDNTEDPRRDRFHYFRGIRTMLAGRGFRAFHASVPWAGSVEQRAAVLREQVLEVLAGTAADKVHLVAHSMGGLDARHMLFADRAAGRIHERIASLVTIGTPHRGSPFADWLMRHCDRALPLAARLGLDLAAVPDLTTEAARAFDTDPEVVAFEDELVSAVALRSYAGRQGSWGIGTALRAAYPMVKRAEGDNDGVVSVRSARWRSDIPFAVLGSTDHFNEIVTVQPSALGDPRACGLTSGRYCLVLSWQDLAVR